MSKKDRSRLTVKELKKHKEMQIINDEKANTIIESLYQLSLLAYKMFKKRNV